MDHLHSSEQIPSPEQALESVYSALQQKGYNPVMQIVGYLLTEDPTYITNYEGARALIGRIDRDELLTLLGGYHGFFVYTGEYDELGKVVPRNMPIA